MIWLSEHFSHKSHPSSHTTNQTSCLADTTLFCAECPKEPIWSILSRKVQVLKSKKHLSSVGPAPGCTGGHPARQGGQITKRLVAEEEEEQFPTSHLEHQARAGHGCRLYLPCQIFSLQITFIKRDRPNLLSRLLFGQTPSPPPVRSLPDTDAWAPRTKASKCPPLSRVVRSSPCASAGALMKIKATH